MSGEVNFFWVIALLWGMFVTIFWMVIGWRAMRAHERIAGSLSPHPPPAMPFRKLPFKPRGGPAAQPPPPDPEAPATQ
jgi:hypothetical protein